MLEKAVPSNPVQHRGPEHREWEAIASESADRVKRSVQMLEVGCSVVDERQSHPGGRSRRTNQKLTTVGTVGVRGLIQALRWRPPMSEQGPALEPPDGRRERQSELDQRNGDNAYTRVEYA